MRGATRKCASRIAWRRSADQTRMRFGGSSFCTVVPQVDPHCGQTYSYLSPSGRTSSRRLRTFTARLHFGQASRLASKRSNAGRRFSFIAFSSLKKWCHQCRFSATCPSVYGASRAALRHAPATLSPSLLRITRVAGLRREGSLLRVVKDNAEAEARARLEPADAVANVDARV